MKKQLLLSFIICFNASVLQAQFGQQWVQSYDDSLHYDNLPNAIAINNAGCTIVTGATKNTTNVTTQMRTIKYDVSGNVLWQVNYSPTSVSYYPSDITTDANGNIFISTDVFDGTSVRLHVLKYTCSGSLVWDVVSPTIRLFTNFSKRIALDANGNVFVGTTSDCWNCYAWAQSNYGEATITKFDSNGNYITEMRTGQTGIFQLFYSAYVYFNQLTDMDISANMNSLYSITNLNQDSLVYFNLPNLQDFALLKYDTNGTITFLKKILRPLKQDFPVDMFIDGNEDIFITGWTKDTVTNAKKSYLTAKIDLAGNIAYVKEHGDTSWNSEGMSIVADGLGYAYVAGRTFENGATADIELIKYDPNGNEVWVRTYNSSFNNWDNPVANSIHIDAQANIYINAYSSNGNNHDFLILKYDSAGSLIGEHRYNGASNQNDYPVEMAVNASGEVFNTGSSQSLNGNDFLTIKFGFPTIATGDSLCSTVGINEVKGDELNFSIYPNPVSSQLTIQCSKEMKEIKIMDVLGDEIYKTNNLHPTSEIIIPTSEFSNGIYFIHLKTVNRNVTRKFVKL